MKERFELFTVLIAKISRSIRKIKTEEMEEFDLKSPHVSCLYYLFKSNNLTATELCEICQEDKSAISRSLDYLESKGYTGTQFSDTDGESYTTSEDLIRLMDKMYKNTNFFPYSDMYKKMRNSSLDTAIKANLPEGCSSVNLAYISDEEMFEAGIIYTPNGNFAFVCSADSADDSVKTAISESVAAMCSAASKDSGDE